jgi:hypothetical protein
MIKLPPNTFVLLGIDKSICPETGRLKLRFLQWLRKGQRMGFTFYRTL